MTSATVETVLAWHAALHQADVERVLSLSTEDVEVGGPRGAGRGADLLRDWVARAGVRLEPGRIFSRGEVVVVEQSARWPSGDGQPADPQVVEPSARWPSGGGHLADPQHVASVFLVNDGRVASVIRHVDLPTALQAGGLQMSDEYVAAPSPD